MRVPTHGLNRGLVLAPVRGTLPISHPSPDLVPRIADMGTTPRVIGFNLQSELVEECNDVKAAQHRPFPEYRRIVICPELRLIVGHVYHDAREISKEVRKKGLHRKWLDHWICRTSFYLNLISVFSRQLPRRSSLSSRIRLGW
jgi:hypothetical protein